VTLCLKDYPFVAIIATEDLNSRTLTINPGSVGEEYFASAASPFSANDFWFENNAVMKQACGWM